MRRRCKDKETLVYGSLNGFFSIFYDPLKTRSKTPIKFILLSYKRENDILASIRRFGNVRLHIKI